MPQLPKEKCYGCKHRRDLPGDCHSQCAHPLIFNPFVELLYMTAATKLEIKGNAHGIAKGWFLWPLNFDPVWLDNCNGYEPKGEPCPSPTTSESTLPSSQG